MHPPLAEHKHEGCLKAIQALDECHNSGFMNRFTGACNATKAQLDECLKEEFLVLRAENKAKAAAKRAKLEKIWKEMEEPPKSS